MKTFKRFILTSICSLYATTLLALPSGSKFISIKDFSGGINTTQDSGNIAENESSYLANVRVDEKDGSLTQRDGFAVAGSTNTLSRITFIGKVNKSNGDACYVVSDSSIVLATQDFTNYTRIHSGLNTSRLISYTQFLDRGWFTNGSENVFTYDCVSMSSYSFIPKGNFIESYQGRLWTYNTTTDKSALYFSEAISTDGYVIDPTIDYAWDTDVQKLDIGSDDGDTGTFLKVYKGRLYAGKNLSIHSIYGDDISNYMPVKTSAKVGFTANDGVTLQDNLMFGYTKEGEGVYAFDGSDVMRLTDKIVPDMRAVDATLSNVSTIKWETRSDFNKGTFSNTTSTVYGAVLLFSASQYANTAQPTVPSGPFEQTSSTISSNWAVVVPTVSFPSGSIWHVETISIWARGQTAGDDAKIRIRNTRTGESSWATLDAPLSWAFTLTPCTALDDAEVEFTAEDILNSSFTIKIETNTATSVNTIDYYASTTTGFANIILKPAKYGSFTSEIATATAVVSWDNFNSLEDMTDGAITYAYRSSSTVNGVTQSTFIPIISGSIIGSTPTYNYIQWMATITTTISNDETPYVDMVSLGYNIGGASYNRPLMVSWKNRIGLVVTTNTTLGSSLIYWKSKETARTPMAWVVDRGISIKSIYNTGTVLYGGSATDGSIYRLDYSNSDNGSAIEYIYDTKGYDGGNPWFKKKLMEYWVDANKNGSTMQIGTSVDGGDYSYLTLDLSGSGRYLKALNVASSSYYGKYFKFRFYANSLNYVPQIDNLTIIYTDSEVRQ